MSPQNRLFLTRVLDWLRQGYPDGDLGKGDYIALFGVLVGFVAGVKSRDTATLTGLAIGAFLGTLAAFPLLALGLATS